MRKFTIYNLQFTIPALIFTLYILHCTFYITPTYAHEEIGVANIYPSSPLYFLKVFKENLELKFAKNQEKMAKNLELASTRLEEVNSLIINKKEDYIPATLERYWGLIRGFPEKIQDRYFSVKLGQNLATHLFFLEEIYNELGDPKAEMAVRAAINRLLERDELPGNARSAACSFLVKEASSSSLLEIEKIVLSERAQRCLNP